MDILFLIWDKNRHDWLREYPSLGRGMLSFQTRAEAEARACQYFGYTDYPTLEEEGWAEVRQLNIVRETTFKMPID